MKQLINLSTIFLGIIGGCFAILVSFILFIYPNLDNNSTINNTNIIENAAVASDQIESQSQVEKNGSEELLSNTRSNGESIKSGTYTIDDIEFWFSDSVINDITGKWRISSIASSKDITEYATDYYNTFFISDDEIHAIINFSLNTTTSISVLPDGLLDVAIHEYIDGEEHDAKLLFGGMLLKEYFINPETNEYEEAVTNNTSIMSTEKSVASNDPSELNSVSTETTGQKNALRSAKNYINIMNFSYQGLIEQLEFEKYPHEDAVYAADNCGADWNEQALRSARNYLSLSAFSYKGLIEQLEFEKFTPEQATYSVDNCGADWNEQAKKSARNYMDLMSFSRDGLIEQLEFEGYTHDQAVYGIESNGY